MAREYILTTPKGEEYKLRLRSRDHEKLCKTIGMGINEGMARIAAGDYVPFMVNLIHLSAQENHRNFTKNDAYDIMDEFIDAGYDFMKILALATDIMESFGFFDKALTSDARQLMEQA